jgi:hypothetical protein
MRLSRMIGCALALAFAAGVPAKAQTTVDAAKITCEQWLTFKVADPDYIAIWLSGWYHAKQNSTLVGVQEFKANINQLKDACIRNQNVPLMKIIEDYYASKKK